MQNERKTGRVALAALIGAAVLAACGGGDDGPSADDKQEVIEHYATGVHAAYEASLGSATEMDAALDAFVADPTDETLAAAKQAWLGGA